MQGVGGKDAGGPGFASTTVWLVQHRLNLVGPPCQVHGNAKRGFGELARRRLAELPRLLESHA